MAELCPDCPLLGYAKGEIAQIEAHPTDKIDGAVLRDKGGNPSLPFIPSSTTFDVIRSKIEQCEHPETVQNGGFLRKKTTIVCPAIGEVVDPSSKDYKLITNEVGF